MHRNEGVGDGGQRGIERRGEEKEEGKKGRRERREGGGLRGGEDYHAELDCSTARLLVARGSAPTTAAEKHAGGDGTRPVRSLTVCFPPLLSWG